MTEPNSKETKLQQLTSAIQVSLNPMQATQVTEAQSFLHNVKQLNDGWSYFLELFTRCGPQQQDIAFVCLGCLCDVVRAVPFPITTPNHLNTSSSSPNQHHQLQTQTQSTTPSSIVTAPSFLSPIREVILRWLQQNVTQGTLQYQPKFLKTKIALLYILLIKIEYPTTWESPFTFLFQMINATGDKNNPRPNDTYDFFFRMTKILMDEIVAYDTSRSKTEISRNVEVKRAMKLENVVPRIVEIFVKVMNNSGEAIVANGSNGSNGSNGGNSIGSNGSNGSIGSNGNNSNGNNSNGSSEHQNIQHIELISLCLQTMSEWIGWMDLTLVTSPVVLSALFNCLNSIHIKIRMETCICLRELVDKNMSSIERVTLLSTIGLVDVLCQYGVPTLTKPSYNNNNNNESNNANTNNFEQFNNSSSSNSNSNAYSNYEQEEELAEELASLVNSITYRLICCHDVLVGNSKSDSTASDVLMNGGDGWTSELATVCDNMLIQVLELTWGYFRHSNIGIAEETLSSIQAIVKTMNRETSNRVPRPERSRTTMSSHLPMLLRSLEMSLRYPVTYSHHGTSCLNGVGSRFHDGGSLNGSGTGTAALAKRGALVDEGTEEDADFDAFRDRLEPIFVNLVRIATDVTTSYVVNRTSEMFLVLNSNQNTNSNTNSNTNANQHSNSISMEELETVLLMVRLCRTGSTTPEFTSLIRTIHVSGINTHSHRAVLLEYYELSLKYSHVLSTDSDCLGIVLQTFCGPSGLHHPDATVRGQCCYHLRALCKQLSSSLKANERFVQVLLQQLHPHLLIPLSTNHTNTTTTNNTTTNINNINTTNTAFTANTANNSNTTDATNATNSTNITLLTFPDRLHLYDVSGLLITRCVSEQVSTSMLETVLSPLLHILNGGASLWHQTINSNSNRNNQSSTSTTASLSSSATATSPTSTTSASTPHVQQDDDAGSYLARCVQAVGFTTKTFPPTLPPSIREMYRLLLESSLCCLVSNHSMHNGLRTQVIFLFHRMVACLGEHLVPYLPTTLPPLISTTTAKNAVETFQLVNQLLSKYPRTMSSVVNRLALPMITQLFTLMPSCTPRTSPLQSPTDDQLLSESLQRVFVLFLQNVVMNQMSAVFCTPAALPYLGQILQALLRACSNVPDPNVAKSTFVVLKNLTEQFLGGGQNGTNGQEGNALENYNKMIPNEAKMMLRNLLLNEGTSVMMSTCVRCGYDPGDAAMTLSMHKEVVGLQKGKEENIFFFLDYIF